MRWVICALLFFAATINYVDRQVIGILKPTLQAQFGWSEIDYADIVFAFQLAYAGGFLIAGRMMDRIGARLGFRDRDRPVEPRGDRARRSGPCSGPQRPPCSRYCGLTYSASVAGFMVARFALGLGEAGNFPAAIKVTAEWFPKRERALATGIFNSGTNVGALVTPLVVPWITLTCGWYWAFVATGALGFIWLAFWCRCIAVPTSIRGWAPRSSHTSAAIRRIRPPTSRGSKLLGYRQTWAFMIGKFLTDPIWWLYLFWIPDFLNRNHGIDLKTIGPPLVAIYLVADVGQHRWRLAVVDADQAGMDAPTSAARSRCWSARSPSCRWSSPRARSDLWVAVALVSIAAAAHQGWSANLFTTASDMFPRKAVGSVVGLGGMAGAVGGMLIAKLTGYILQATGSYLPVFFIAAFAYLVALAIIHVLVPRLRAGADVRALSDGC